MHVAADRDILAGDHGGADFAVLADPGEAARINGVRRIEITFDAVPVHTNVVRPDQRHRVFAAQIILDRNAAVTADALGKGRRGVGRIQPHSSCGIADCQIHPDRIDGPAVTRRPASVCQRPVIQDQRPVFRVEADLAVAQNVVPVFLRDRHALDPKIAGGLLLREAEGDGGIILHASAF